MSKKAQGISLNVLIIAVFALLVALILFVIFINRINPFDASLDDTPQAMAEHCRLNTTPAIFLYPAIDLESEEPVFFENTTYEIIREGDYLGKFKGDKFNNSFLNITSGDKLQMIVSAKSDDCYVSNEVIEYYVPCESTDSIHPKLRCTDKWFSFTAYNPNDDLPMKMGDIIKTTHDEVIVELKVRDNERFNTIGCSYDWKIIDRFNAEGMIRRYTPKGIVEQDRIYEMYESYYIYEPIDETWLSFSFDESKKFNTTVICTFFDSEYIIRDYDIAYDIAYDIYIKDKDVGQPNPSFNFTIVKR